MITGINRVTLLSTCNRGPILEIRSSQVLYCLPSPFHSLYRPGLRDSFQERARWHWARPNKQAFSTSHKSIHLGLLLWAWHWSFDPITRFGLLHRSHELSVILKSWYPTQITDHLFCSSIKIILWAVAIRRLPPASPMIFRFCAPPGGYRVPGAAPGAR